MPREEALVRLTEAARTFARTAQHLGIDVAEAAAMVKAELESLG